MLKSLPCLRTSEPIGSRLVTAAASAVTAVVVGNFMPPAPGWWWPLLGLGLIAAWCGLHVPTGRRGWWAACGVMLGLAACARAPRAPAGAVSDPLPIRFEVVARDGWSRGVRGWRTRATPVRLEWAGRWLPLPNEIEMDVTSEVGEALLPSPGTGWRGAGELVFDGERPLQVPYLRVKTLLLLSPTPRHSFVDAVREGGVRALRRAAGVDPGRLRAAGLAAAVVLGRRENLQENEVIGLRRSGLAHLLAVAGLHVAAFGVLVWGVLRLAGVRLVTRRWVLAGALVGFALLAGGNLPVRRAAVAAVAYLIARQIGRPLLPVPTVWAVVGGLAILDPATVLQPAFQLTATVTLALVRWTGVVANWTRLPLRLAQTVAVALVAQVASAPIIGHHFANVPPLGLVANLAAAPLALLLVGGSMLALLASTCSAWLGGLFLVVVAESQRLLDMAATVGGLVSLPFPPLPTVLALAFAVGAGVALTRSRWASGAALLLAVASGAWIAWPAAAAHRVNELRFLGVREGMALLVRSGAAAILVDTGRSGSEAWRELARERVHRLDALVLTHPDADHIGGAATLLDRMPVVRLAFPRALGDSGQIVTLRRIARRRGIEEVPLERGQRAALGGIACDVFWPPSVMGGVDNDASLVARLTLGAVRLLVTGDLEARGEAALLGSGALLRAEVLQLPHHGSRTSSTAGFLSAVKPLVALAVTGTRPRFAYPDAVVVHRVMAVPAVVVAQAAGAVWVAWAGSGPIVVGCEPPVFVPLRRDQHEH
ncbi:MAG: DNA internalization-related competence protein ComEC/Rec2 [Thermoanaerobaculales bacterium]